MRERSRLFKRYWNENNPTFKVAKNSKYKNARNLVILKVKNSEIIGIVRFIFESIQNMLKKPKGGFKLVGTLKSKDETAPNLLIANKNVITNKNYIADIFNDLFVNVDIPWSFC